MRREEQTISLEDVQKAAARMMGSDDFETLLAFLNQERERLFSDLGPCETPNDVMKQSGKIAAIQELIDVIS